MFAWCLALQSAGNSVRVKQLNYAIGGTVLQSQLPTGPAAEAFLQVSDGHPPLAEGPGHLHHGRVQSQRHCHGHDEHRVEDDQEWAYCDLVPERPLFIVHQEDVVPGKSAIVEGGDEGEEENQGGAGDTPEDNMWPLTHT